MYRLQLKLLQLEHRKEWGIKKQNSGPAPLQHCKKLEQIMMGSPCPNMPRMAWPRLSPVQLPPVCQMMMMPAACLRLEELMQTVARQSVWSAGLEMLRSFSSHAGTSVLAMIVPSLFSCRALHAPCAGRQSQPV